MVGKTKPQGGYIALKMGDIAWIPYFHFVCRRHISEIEIVCQGASQTKTPSKTQKIKAREVFRQLAIPIASRRFCIA